MVVEVLGQESPWYVQKAVDANSLDGRDSGVQQGKMTSAPPILSGNCIQQNMDSIISEVSAT